MRRSAWIGAVGIVAVLVTVLEVERNLHGPWWAVGIASSCVAIVALLALYLLATWIDKRDK